MRERMGMWRRAAACVTLGAIVMGGLPVPAGADEPPFEIDLEMLSDRLLAAQVQMHHGGQQGLERLMLSAELLEWRRQHPQASESEIMSHLEARKDGLTDGLTPNDRVLGDADFALRAAAVLVADPESTAAAAPQLRRVIEIALGKSLASFDAREDLVNGSLRVASWLRARSEVEAELWASVRHQALQDVAFASAWNGVLGYPVDATASLAQMKADPQVSALVNVDAILAQQGSRPAFLAEVERQFDQVMARLATESTEARARLKALSTACPVQADAACTPQQQAAAVAKAAAEQKEIDKAEAVGKLLGGLARAADQKKGEKLEKVVTSLAAIVSAINKYAEAVAGRSVQDAFLSSATLVMAGNVLGAVMAIVSLFGESGPSLDQQILDQIGKLRQEVRALHLEMRASFERIEARLDLVFQVMIEEFDRLNATLAGHTAALTSIQNSLAEQDLRLETVAATILTAIGDVELHDARSAVNKYIGYRETYGVPIPSFGEYTGPENEFHYAATGVATHSSFVVPVSQAGDPTVDPRVVLDSHGEAASLSYLARLARFRDPRVPEVEAGDPFANPAVWNFGAQAYTLLALQNPNYAQQVSGARTEQIGLEEKRIVDVASSFSRPASPAPGGDPTNPIFTSLMAEYRGALGRLGARLAEIRTREILVRRERDKNAPPGTPFTTQYKNYGLFGTASQALPESTLPPDSATLFPCSSSSAWISIVRPANVAFKHLAPELRFANYAYSPQMEDTPRLPELSQCYEAQFVNHRVVTTAHVEDTYARLRLTMRTRFRWARVPDGQPPTLPDEQWRNARGASYTWPEVQISRECLSYHCTNAFNVSEAQEMAKRWPSGKSLFEQSASITADQSLVSSARTQMEAFLSGRQRAFYLRAATEVHDANQPLNQAGLDMSEAARQLQAYTRLGFPVALAGDDILSSVLFGRYSLLVNEADPRLDTTFATAFNQYACTPSVAVGQPCFNAFGGAFQPLRSQPHLETYASGIAITAPIYCSAPTAGVPALPGDPVGDCVAASATRTVNALALRLRRFSEFLVAGKYQERLPWITSTLATLPLVDTLVRVEPSN